MLLAEIACKVSSVTFLGAFLTGVGLSVGRPMTVSCDMVAKDIGGGQYSITCEGACSGMPPPTCMSERVANRVQCTCPSMNCTAWWDQTAHQFFCETIYCPDPAECKVQPIPADYWWVCLCEI